MYMTPEDIVRATQGTVCRRGSATACTAVATDSRTLPAHAWFVALKGPHFNGHQFLADGIARGADGLIVSEEIADGLLDDATSPWIVQVSDTQAALGSIAQSWRAMCKDATVVAITGSNGKSTTKEMIAAIATSQGSVLKTEGNFNNLIGVPLTLFRLKSSDAMAVIEMGMSEAGEIAQLTQMVNPDIAVITNVSAAHLDTLQTIENVAAAKGELFASMRRDGIIVVNMEDPWVRDLASNFPGRKITFGMRNECDVQFGRVHAGELAESHLTLYIHGKEFHLTIPLPGTHNVMNALAATAVGVALDIVPEDIVARLPRFTPMRMRMERVQLVNGVQVINDSYNANPESFEAALRTVGAAKRAGRFIVVMGDMLELGQSAHASHVTAGRQVQQYGADALLVLGEHASAVLAGAQESGMTSNAVTSFEMDAEALQSSLLDMLRSGDVVLVKGSRGMAMETIVEFLKRRVGVC
jgi:UDP-N-acetylmuramoyl-tripeptide--D-alanyl-D-alanine ligase